MSPFQFYFCYAMQDKVNTTTTTTFSNNITHSDVMPYISSSDDSCVSVYNLHYPNHHHHHHHHFHVVNATSESKNITAILLDILSQEVVKVSKTSSTTSKSSIGWILFHACVLFCLLSMLFVLIKYLIKKQFYKKFRKRNITSKSPAVVEV